VAFFLITDAVAGAIADPAPIDQPARTGAGLDLASLILPLIRRASMSPSNASNKHHRRKNTTSQGEI
jgi:hypothetical protein